MIIHAPVSHGNISNMAGELEVFLVSLISCLITCLELNIALIVSLALFGHAC